MAPPNPPGRGQPAPDQVAEAVAGLRTAVAGLAREVESMRRAQRQVASAGELSRLAATVADLSETVSVIQSIGGGKRSRQPDADAIPSWLTLPRDQPSARAVLSDLTAWLRDVYLRYGDAARDFPECWLWHPEIVEELVWLMYAWLAAYRDDPASGRAAGDWHDRLRPGVVRRIHGYATTCSLENHLPGRPRATGAPQVPLTDDPTDDPTGGRRRAVEVIAAWWSQHRDQPAPAPTNDQMTAAAAAARKARTGTSAANGSHHSTGGTR
jgi:hypothetical protein